VAAEPGLVELDQGHAVEGQARQRITRLAGQQIRSLVCATAELQWVSDVIERQVHQMTRLVDDLLDVSRITRGKIELRKELVELASVVRSAVEASRPLIEKWGHRLTVTIPPEPIRLEADPARLAQVFSNILTNAAKYTDHGGHIRITVEPQSDHVVIRVQDDGIGIPKDALPRIFDMFTQLPASLERSEGGLGIGLTLVRRMVELHGGAVEARSVKPEPAIRASGTVIPRLTIRFLQENRRCALAAGFDTSRRLRDARAADVPRSAHVRPAAEVQELPPGHRHQERTGHPEQDHDREQQHARLPSVRRPACQLWERAARLQQHRAAEEGDRRGHQERHRAPRRTCRIPHDAILCRAEAPATRRAFSCGPWIHSGPALHPPSSPGGSCHHSSVAPSVAGREVGGERLSSTAGRARTDALTPADRSRPASATGARRGSTR